FSRRSGACSKTICASTFTRIRIRRAARLSRPTTCGWPRICRIFIPTCCNTIASRASRTTTTPFSRFSRARCWRKSRRAIPPGKSWSRLRSRTSSKSGSCLVIMGLEQHRSKTPREVARRNQNRIFASTPLFALSTPFHKYDHVCGEGFLAQTRRERRAYPSEGSVRSEQRRLGRKEPPPGGLRRFSVLALLLLGHSPTSGDAPSSRLARTENRRNQRARIYET